MGLSGSIDPTPPNTTPSNIYTPFGDIENGGGNGSSSTYAPQTGAGSPYDPQQMQSEQAAIGSLTQQLDQPYSISQAINNPYTQQYYQNLQAPTAYNYQQEQAQLDNNNNAKNLNGGSAAVLANNLLTQGYNAQSATNQNTAMSQGLDIYNNQIQNTQNALAANQNAYNDAFQQTYAPFTQGTQYQSQALNPLVGYQTQAYGDQLQQQTAMMQALLNPGNLGSYNSQTGSGSGLIGAYGMVAP
jgi:hypothetical protein